MAGCEAKRYCERMDAATVMVWYPGEVHNHSPPGSEIKAKRASTTGGAVKRPKRPKGGYLECGSSGVPCRLGALVCV